MKHLSDEDEAFEAAWDERRFQLKTFIKNNRDLIEITSHSDESEGDDDEDHDDDDDDDDGSGEQGDDDDDSKDKRYLEDDEEIEDGSSA